jgi:hypothetical protein
VALGELCRMSWKQGDLLTRGKGWKVVLTEKNGLAARSRRQGDLLARGRGRKAVLLGQAALRVQRKREKLLTHDESQKVISPRGKTEVPSVQCFSQPKDGYSDLSRT